MKTAIEMAREAGAIHIHERPKEFAIVGNEAITRFAELVREQAIAEANAKANASWTLMCEKMVAIERERIAKWYESEGHMMFPVAIPKAIRSGK